MLFRSCISAPYPEPLAERDLSSEADFALMSEIVRAVRNIRTEMQISPSEKTELHLFAPSSSREKALAEKHPHVLLALTPTASLTFLDREPAQLGATALVGSLRLFIPIPESLRAREATRLEKEKEKLEKLAHSTAEKLANAEFRTRAPAEVVQKLEESLSQVKQQLADIAKKRAAL